LLIGDFRLDTFLRRLFKLPADLHTLPQPFAAGLFLQLTRELP
jgi:hypothetical protein